MTDLAAVAFSSPYFFAVAVVLFAIGCGICLARRPDIGRRSLILLAFGGVLIALAAGEPIVNLPGAGSITVMVDLSPSTRGATFRDRAALDARLGQLLVGQRYRLIAFADAIHAMPSERQLLDIPADQTLFTPPPSDAVVLFSDGRFELPATGPPTYPVIDPALNQTGDAAVSQLVSSGRSVIATVKNAGGPRSLRWINATPLTPPAVDGSFEQYATPDGPGEITAGLSPGDRWPENDALSIQPVSKSSAEKWWIGDAAPAGWRQFAPAALPTDAADYLSAGAIVLRNISAEALSSAQQRRLVQYVLDLGGSLVIVGGNHAFAAGHYDGSALDAMSPLASSPPQPTTHWMLLVDGSGSMAGDGGAGASPWHVECDAVNALLPRLPPDDPVSVGSFAETLSWWSAGKSARETTSLHLPPPSVFPHGPTNLAPVLRQIIASDDGASVVQLLVMTDADADLPNPDAIRSEMIQKKIHLHLLATGHGSALPALRAIAAATGGSVVEQLNPQQWVSAATLLLNQAMPSRYQHEPIVVQFIPPSLPAASVTEWNRVWLRTSATLVGKGPDSPLAGSWQHGLGRVSAIAWPADAATVTALSAQIETPPRDPRFAIHFESGDAFKITVNAVDGRNFLNDLPLHIEWQDGDDLTAVTRAAPIPQVGPGQYALTTPSRRRPGIATVMNGSERIDRFAVAGRYAPEFNEIGNDFSALEELARRTGGAVVRAGSMKPIDFRWPDRSTPVSPELTLAAFVAIAAALVLDRRR